MSDDAPSRPRRAVCLCGLSREMPWCDGSHVGTGIKPRRAADAALAAGLSLCHCGGSAELPFCDRAQKACKDSASNPS